MAKVTYAPLANDDLAEIVSFIAQDNPNAARNWLRKIRETCSLLATNPAMGEQRADFGVAGCRSFTLGNYVVFFRRLGDGVEIARIVHGSRDLRQL